ncbi:lpg2359 family Dot/Icm T4SS effector [Spongiibacter taiwanensis]
MLTMADQTLKQQLTAEMKSAMRAKEKERLAAIRLILSEVKRIEVDERIDVDDERMLVVLDKMCKQRRDSISQYEQAGRDDLASQERFEMEVIQTFMPTPLTDAELDTLIADAISQTGATSMKDMGQVMAILKPQLQGRADMAAVSKKIKAGLQ